MPYIGDTPTTTSFAAVVKDAFSGDGSETAFTLSKIATTNSVAVFVENVRQEPTTAYAVSGTTLTFTAAPVSSSGNNIYVVHMNPTATATHPAAQNLTAVNGTLTGTLAVTGTSTLTGNVTASADLSVGDDLTLGSDAAVLNFGADSDVSLTHVADTGLLLNSTRQLQFNDSSQYINAPSATVLDINATDEIELNATAVDLNGTLDVSGTLGVAGASALTNKLTVLAADGTADDEWVMDVRNDEATDDRSWGLRVSAGSTNTDRALDILDHAQATSLLRVSGTGFVTKPQTPMCSVTKNVNSQVQTISGSTNYTLTGMTSAYGNSYSVNNKSYWNTSNSRFEIPSGAPTAFYRCEFNTLFGITRPSSGVNWGFIGIRKDNSSGLSNNISAQAYREATNGMGTSTYVYDMLSCACIYSLAAGDWVEPVFSGSDGVAMVIHSGNYTNFTVVQVG